MNPPLPMQRPYSRVEGIESRLRAAIGNAGLGFGAGLLLATGLSGCAALAPAVMIPQAAAAIGVAGVSEATCGGGSSCKAQPRGCSAAIPAQVAATERTERSIPIDEGPVASFAPVYWQPPFETATSTRPRGAVEAGAGTLVVTDRSALFVPAVGGDGVRLPLEGVVNVDVQRDPGTGAPAQLVVESCFGRLDRFSFGQSAQPRRLDSSATSAAAAELRNRVAAQRPPTAP